MVTTTKKAALAFKGANGVKQPINIIAMQAFVSANGGMPNVGLQLLPSAVNKGVLFGGGLLWHTMQVSQNTNSISSAGLMLWAAVNGVPTVNGTPSLKNVSTTVPTTFKPIPLSQIQYASSVKATHPLGRYVGGAGVFANKNNPHNTRQNVVAAILNGGFKLSNRSQATYGTAYGQLVAL